MKGDNIMGLFIGGLLIFMFLAWVAGQYIDDAIQGWNEGVAREKRNKAFKEDKK
jgi:hypothetical protein